MPKFSELQKRLKGKRPDLPQAKTYPILNPYKFERALIIDVHNLAWKCYHARNWQGFKTSEGLHSGHVFGAFTKIFAMVRNHCLIPKVPSSLVFVWDEYKDKQVALYSAYKGNRDKKGANPVPDVIGLLTCFPHVLVSIPSKDEEADSIIASYVAQHPTIEHFVLSSDRDMWQLWSKARFFDTATKEFTKKDYEHAFGDIPPKMIPLYKAIFGDTSDNMPYVINSDSEVGQKTRSEVINILKHIHKPSELFGHLSKVSFQKHRILLKEKSGQIRTMYKVARLHRKSKILVTNHSGDFSRMESLIVKKWECRSKQKDIDVMRRLEER